MPTTPHESLDLAGGTRRAQRQKVGVEALLSISRTAPLSPWRRFMHRLFLDALTPLLVLTLVATVAITIAIRLCWPIRRCSRCAGSCRNSAI